METFKNQLVNIPLFYLKDCNNCYFINRNTIYNVDTKKFSKKRVKSSSVGYNINGNFVLEKNIVKIKAERLSNNEKYKLFKNDFLINMN